MRIIAKTVGSILFVLAALLLPITASAQADFDDLQLNSGSAETTDAEKAQPDKFITLGQQNERGLGQSQDFVEAYKWYNLAAAEGSEEAFEAREALAERMTAEQIAEAQASTREWLARTGEARSVPADDQIDAELVSMVEELLILQGFNPGPLDGVADDETMAAIRRYQAREHLVQDGRVTIALAEHLLYAPTNLFEAAERGDTAAVERMLAEGADPNAADEDGWTPLMFATTTGQRSIVEELLKAGAESNAQANDGATALIGATIGGHADLITLLLEEGADPTLQTRQGLAARDIAARIDDEAVLTAFRAAEPPTLFSAAEAGDVEALLLLIEEGEMIDQVDEQRATPLMLAAAAGQNEAVDVLLTHGADPNLAGPKSMTPLMLAAMGGHEEIVARILDDERVDPVVRNDDGLMAFDLAKQAHHQPVVDILLPLSAEAVEIRLNLSRNDRRLVQISLSDLGFDTRGIDGLLGKHSRKAIGDWQNFNNYPVTGFLLESEITVLIEQARSEIEKKKQRSIGSTGGEKKEKDLIIGLDNTRWRRPSGSIVRIEAASADSINMFYEVAPPGFSQFSGDLTGYFKKSNDILVGWVYQYSDNCPNKRIAVDAKLSEIGENFVTEISTQMECEATGDRGRWFRWVAGEPGSNLLKRIN